jgi:hypothetical protein
VLGRDALSLGAAGELPRDVLAALTEAVTHPGRRTTVRVLAEGSALRLGFAFER